MTTAPQGHDELVIGASAEAIWALIEDTALLPAWVPMVHSVDAPAGRREHVGAVRTCDVEIMGRRGQVTERCTQLDPGRWAYYVVDNDTLGFARMVSEFGFSIGLEPAEPSSTTVSLTSYYRPRGLAGRLANLLMLRRLFRRSRRAMLSHLRGLAEHSRQARA